MSVTVQTTTENIPWQGVADLLAFYGLSQDDADTQREIFTHGYSVVFLFAGAELMGCGHTLSDGICQAAIYNIALDERYHVQIKTGMARYRAESLAALKAMDFID